eukprot:gene19212-21136_t
MSARKSRKTPSELKAIQDERLTCRHIQTLMKLQQCTDENEQLKKKIKLLQDETSSCQELHTVARSSQLEIKNLKEDFSKQINAKIKELNNSKQNEIAQISAEIDRIQVLCAQRVEKMECMNNSLELEVKEKSEMLERFKETQNNTEELQSKLHAQSSRLENKKEENKKLTAKITELTTTNSNLLNEKTLALKKIESLEAKITTMTAKLQSEIDIKRKLMGQNDFVKEIHKLKEEITTLETVQKDQDIELQNCKETISEYKQKLSMLEQSNSLLELERDALSQSSGDLTREVEYLKKRDTRPSDATSLNEFVSLKRELASLKTENSRLKIAASRTEMKVLKADGKKTGAISLSKGRK